MTRTLPCVFCVLLLPCSAAGREDNNPGRLKMALVNLRCQLTDGPDPLYSRGVPILFKNAVNTVGFSGSYLQTGWIVTAR